MLFHNLPTDLMTVIMEVLPLDDIYKLQDVCTYNLSNFIHKLMIKRIKFRLNKIGLGDAFMEALISSNAIISGSFILQALLGEDWKTDVDIFQKSDYDPENTCRRSGKFSPIENYLWENSGKDDTKFEYDNYFQLENVGIDIVRTYSINNINIQVINIGEFINYDNIIHTLNNFIKNQFDFTFCMNTYDGLNLNIFDPQSIKNKTSTNKFIKIQMHENQKCDIGTVASNIHYRCLKYMDKGFTITNYKKPSRIAVELWYSGHECYELLPNNYHNYYLDKLSKRTDIKIIYYCGDKLFIYNLKNHNYTQILNKF